MFLLLGIILILIVVFNQKIFRTFFAFLLFFILGISSVFIDNSENYDSYYNHYLKENSSVILKIDKILKSSNYHYKYDVNVVQIDSVKTRGKVLLNVLKDSAFRSFKVDELIFAKPEFLEVNKSLNPYQFDYRFYLAKQGIHHQIFLTSDSYKSSGIQGFSLVGLSANFRDKVQESLREYNFKNDEFGVINALLLGQRQEISKDLIADYSKAGAIHILAVSGLHVGIILLILTNLLKPMERLKNGRIIKTILIVFLLWGFAFVAGLSASVVRAVTMFTFLAIGMSFKRKNIVLFSLITSMFFLLIFKPMFLFDVGFQLSYLAVFGIVLVQPKLYTFWKTKYKIIDYFWQLTTVSIAAQIGILPLSLYYFHQFPGLFILSNLIIIPCLGVILLGGILIISLALIGVLPQFLADFYGAVISMMNNFVGWISSQEQFLFTEISLSFLMMLVCYFAIFLGVYFLIKISSKRLLYVLASILLVQSVFLYENHRKKTKKEFIVFYKSRNTILGNRIGEKLIVTHDLDSLEISKTNFMVSYRINENIIPVYRKGFSNIFSFEKDKILIVDSLGVYQLKNLNKPIVLLQQSPKINLERLIKEIDPKEIIADGSNYKSYVKRWQETSKKLEIPFYYTAEKGAYILKK
ncbi:MAG: ComEC/Rec2 family competence protein [Polaribacter sp.]|uniref:ComEC/Rec2 family competence protein n=1 Tax=Polaribacter sp. TaxID=1920175 RepID=UPI003BB08D70